MARGFVVDKARANILPARDLRHDRARRRNRRQYPRSIFAAPLPTTLPPRNQFYLAHAVQLASLIKPTLAAQHHIQAIPVKAALGVGLLLESKVSTPFDFGAQPSLNKPLVLELARCEWIEKRHNEIALGSSATGKTHIALALGLAACQKGHSVAFTTDAALVHELMEARNERRLRTLQKHLNTVRLLVVDELGYVPFTAVGSELLFEVFSQRYERAATLITSNLPFDEWTTVFGSERLTGAPLDRLTHHVHILEMNGDSFRLPASQKAQRRTSPASSVLEKAPTDGGTGAEI